MTEGTSAQWEAQRYEERKDRVPEDRDVALSVVGDWLVCLGFGVLGLVASSTTARAHGAGHAVPGHSDAIAPFLIVLGLPAFAGLAGGVMAVRYRRRVTSGPSDRHSPVAVGLLIVALGIASLLSALEGHSWLLAAGVIFGAVTALRFERGETAFEAGCGNHAELTLGAISTHRLLEGVLVGTLYTAGEVVGLVGAIVLAGHAALETAAVGGLYGTARGRIRVVGAIVLVQAGYVVGLIAGLGVLGAIPVSARAFMLALMGGVLLIVGVGETERSINAGRPTRFN